MKRFWIWPEANPDNPIGLASFLYCIRAWWRKRPVLIKCEFCGEKMWWNGHPDAPVFCGPNCVEAHDYNVVALGGNEDIPF